MSKGDFVWCDLSAYRVDTAKAFYRKVFGWNYKPVAQLDGTPYHVAFARKGEAAAIFEMPEKFQKIGLPSFWMPYIAVDHIEDACAAAARRGGRIEIEPTAFSERDAIALIRDPLGAGFTVYEGTGLAPLKDYRKGHMAWRGLYVSDPHAVKDFYAAIFDWRFSQDPALPSAFRVCNALGVDVAEIVKVGEDLRGPHEFWGIHFAAGDLRKAKAAIEKHGGEIIFEDAHPEQPTVLAKDPGGAAFFVV